MVNSRESNIISVSDVITYISQIRELGLSRKDSQMWTWDLPVDLNPQILFIRPSPNLMPPILSNYDRRGNG
jgi:hypothetical protein